MTPELTALTLSALLQIVQFALYAIPANRELGPGYTMSARDRARSRPLSDRTARLGRAMENHFEGLILFGIAVMILHLSAQTTAFTAWMAWIYLIARICYIPAYAYGWKPGRSVIWAIGFAATAFMLIAALI